MHQEYEAPYFLTNIPAANAELVRQAAKDTGASVYTDNNATDKHGRVLTRFVAVYSTDKKDKTVFWQRYNELRVAAGLER